MKACLIFPWHHRHAGPARSGGLLLLLVLQEIQYPQHISVQSKITITDDENKTLTFVLNEEIALKDEKLTIKLTIKHSHFTQHTSSAILDLTLLAYYSS